MIRLLLHARLHWSSGIEYALVALKRLVDTGVAVSLRIVGDGPDRDRIRFAIIDMGLGETVELRTDEESGNAYASADVLVLPVLIDGEFPVIRQAMSNGLPVVATRQPSIEMTVGDGVAGYCVPPRDPDALTEAIRRLTDDGELRASMASEARARA